VRPLCLLVAAILFAVPSLASHEWNSTRARPGGFYTFEIPAGTVFGEHPPHLNVRACSRVSYSLDLDVEGTDTASNLVLGFCGREDALVGSECTQVFLLAPEVATATIGQARRGYVGMFVFVAPATGKAVLYVRCLP
jgi:hypothetical protein